MLVVVVAGVEAAATVVVAVVVIVAGVEAAATVVVVVVVVVVVAGVEAAVINWIGSLGEGDLRSGPL